MLRSFSYNFFVKFLFIAQFSYKAVHSYRPQTLLHCILVALFATHIQIYQAGLKQEIEVKQLGRYNIQIGYIEILAIIVKKNLSCDTTTQLAG